MKAGGSTHNPDDFTLYITEPAAYAKLVLSPVQFWQLHEAVLAHAKMLREQRLPIPAEAVTDLGDE